MESSSPPTIAKKLVEIFKIVYYMLRKGISKRKLMTDLHLLLKRGKLAGKALGNLMTLHHHHHHDASNPSSVPHASSYPSFSCRYVDPASFYNPREVEFSCSNTPSYPPFHVTSGGGGGRKRRGHKSYYYEYEAAAAIAKAFEMLNNEVAPDAEQYSVVPTPSPALMLFGKSPAVARKLRVTDSPFPIKEEDVSDGKVDKEAEEFIRRFYEQLRLQVTPEHGFRQG